ncbi:DUF6861 domain-containing protein [Pseudomonas trivialis]|uniref:Novel toxin 15 n=1 Tax=Pseudomonas trivialis TaxID=200450 RepID=A0A0R2ZBX4_9PSED|nr:polymorphic toxin type 15 domain-containing protein [Pseudomonas trivialis]KRP58335.1 hypothetical protein TU79_20655 [Pseudomonas trivialis]SDS25252.1 Novel toxin 15 [Pseudomonas trivialis]
MSLWGIPSWFQIEREIERHFRWHGIGERHRGFNPLGAPSSFNAPSMDLIRRRINCVRLACDLAEKEAVYNLLKRFADLDIRSVLGELVKVVAEMAMIIIGSALGGAMIGGGAGLMAGGVGAFPGAMAGAAVGVQASSWILGALGLASIAEFFTEGLKPIAAGYIRGISTAWEGPQERVGNPMGSFSSDHIPARQGASEIARSHEAVVILLLSAIVAYLTRGRGNASVLASEMLASKRGARLGQWVLKHEDALKQHPALKPPEPRRGALSPGETTPSNRPSGKDKEPGKGKPNTMLLHEVECFKADKLPVYKVGEFERQLKGQEGGLNRLTVEEYLENIASPVKRSAKASRQARQDLEERLRARFQIEFVELGPGAAKQAAIKKARETMASLAALHNPDLKAGGKDVIADFGDRQVNSSIGPQWRPKIQNLKEAAEKVPEYQRKSTFINVKLHKC